MNTMKKEIRVNFETRTIEVSKSFSKKASVYGSKEYQALQSAKGENDGFSIKVLSGKKSNRITHKGLTYEVMRNYIRNHDSTGRMIELFENRLMGFTEEGLPCESTYGAMKVWFFEQYPEVEEYYNTKKAA